MILPSPQPRKIGPEDGKITAGSASGTTGTQFAFRLPIEKQLS
jgi:hypothetical protein